MYWKVFHLGTALGNTLIGSKYSGQCLIQLTLQLASQLWLQIRTTWELRKTKKQKTFSWASPKDYWIRVWSMLQRTGYSDSYWALQRCAWIELIFLEELWVYTANWALTKEKETLEKEREREREIPLMVAKLWAFCLGCYDLRTWTSCLWLQPQECRTLLPSLEENTKRTTFLGLSMTSVIKEWVSFFGRTWSLSLCSESAELGSTLLWRRSVLKMCWLCISLSSQGTLTSPNLVSSHLWTVECQRWEGPRWLSYAVSHLIDKNLYAQSDLHRVTLNASGNVTTQTLGLILHPVPTLSFCLEKYFKYKIFQRYRRVTKK